MLHICNNFGVTKVSLKSVEGVIREKKKIIVSTCSLLLCESAIFPTPVITDYWQKFQYTYVKVLFYAGIQVHFSFYTNWVDNFSNLVTYPFCIEEFNYIMIVLA